MGAWIETYNSQCFDSPTESHPTWVRGLKPYTETAKAATRQVAPYVGAWIETYN